MTAIYIALGANLSNDKSAFVTALERLEEKNIAVLAVSGLWRSPSWPPGQGHPDYLNAAAEVAFDGTPEDLLLRLQTVEAEFGRVRTVRNAPRPMDLDILDFRGVCQSTDALALPHPRMLTRGFVLLPLSQIAPDWTDPVSANHLWNFIAQLPLEDTKPIKYVGSFF